MKFEHQSILMFLRNFCDETPQKGVLTSEYPLLWNQGTLLTLSWNAMRWNHLKRSSKSYVSLSYKWGYDDDVDEACGVLHL